MPTKPNTQRRELLKALAVSPIAAVATATTAQAEAKPMTTDSLVIALLNLAKRAEASELTHSAELIRRVAQEVLKGEPVSKVSGLPKMPQRPGVSFGDSLKIRKG